MIRKILGILLWIMAALILLGSIANGSFMSDRGSAAATYGAFVGTMLPIVANVLAGIFLVRFDSVYKKTYVEGFKTRKKQCSKIVTFIAVYAVFMFFAGIGAGASGADNYLLAFVVSALPYFVPVMIFAMMLGIYATPFWACQKNFNLDDAMLNEYLSVNETFYSYSEDNTVIASNKVLFFPKTFCTMPFCQIASTKFKNLGVEQDVVFNLTNGKKIEIVAGKKQYDNIVSAIAAYAQSVNQ